MSTDGEAPVSEPGGHVVGRRRFFGYVLAGATLVTAAGPIPATAAWAEEAQNESLSGSVDLNDVMTLAARPTSNLIKVEVHEDSTVSFALPRAETGQGITTSTAMLIAEELDVPVSQVRVTLADARPELVFNQLTGASNTTISTYTPVRTAAAIARRRLLEAAADEFGADLDDLVLREGVISDGSGHSAQIGSLVEKAASENTEEVSVDLKTSEDFSVIGEPQNRIDAVEAVTGRKKFTLDLDVDDALPTMVCRAPTINGTPESVVNTDEVLQMPGVTDVATISTGVAVRAETFGQCIDAVRALEVSWEPGSVDGLSDEDVLQELQEAELPMVPAPPGSSTVDETFTFYFRNNSALEPNCAIADVRSDSAEIWSGLKAPIVARGAIAEKIGLRPSAVTVHVPESGGSFGRKLFFDAAVEAAEASKEIGKPVKLMWHRADDTRQGRTQPMATSRVRISHDGDRVLRYDQRHTSVATDLSHGFGDVVTAMAAEIPGLDGTFAQVFFQLSQARSYDFGHESRLLNEVNRGFNTGSMRNVYSPNVVCARELMVDRLAQELDRDPYEFRRELLTDERARAALDRVAEVGEWGREMPSDTAQGIAFMHEYKSECAVLAEIDCRQETIDREVRDGVTGPRVTKVVLAVDVGLAVNPRGLEAQMQGCVMDGIALAMTSSLHLEDGHFLEASWDNYFYTRQWNTPPEIEVVIMPASGEPGGAGELGVAPVKAAVACAYGRAVGAMPTSFPINHGDLSFEPRPNVPPVPEPPSDGLDNAE
ncbi:xanthine dehydrogenase family protein molybdopterin-binding subunit [Nocardiopsis sp. HNM0947]|uniref:Xanthine dehydrogenase family protein molybdopterin-binding subunit n=1 Tax=Nocardiopsis coralli TaxID=2772213 RepID=A0ABR9NZY7_9ACTN|nr:molybdopterin cofactor-binding domain-containing protein [Nocardiopsis coralli]MBE2997145.1 xanthine dehydrogenase family protein molybdopterin-binding subunit [Nocardiopsis coralli]